MGSWYTFGLQAGFGLGIGVIAAGALGVSTRGVIAAALVASAFTAAFAIPFGWPYVAVGIAGAIVGVLSASTVVRGALRRGGTRLGVASLMLGIGLGLILVTAIPLVGYVAVVALPILATRLRGRQAARFAGLRTLAK